MLMVRNCYQNLDSESDKQHTQKNSDSQLYERIRNLEEIILKKKKHKY